MTYSTILTSKGTTTIPKAFRELLGAKPGMRMEFSQNAAGEIVLTRAKTIEEVRAMNLAWIKKRGIKPATDNDIDNARADFYKKGTKW